ncbi:MAG: hypothetical protein EA425_14420 [Puniceicoccaceae bacterium]|nr:MAG: hypothetical protein EA425_14420 [Puniceicoccaceae bacterium]
MAGKKRHATSNPPPDPGLTKTGGFDEPLRASLSAGEQVWWDWNPATGNLLIKSAVQCILGFNLAECESSSSFWWQQVHPDDLPSVAATLRNHLSGQTEFWSIEHRFRTPEGEWVWVEQTGEVVEKDAAGNPTRMVGITRRVQVQHHLAELFAGADNLIRHLMHRIPVDLWIRDTTGTIIWQTEASTATWGFLTGTDGGELFADPAEVESWQGDFLAALAGKESHGTRRFNAGGKPVLVSCQLIPLVENDRITGTIEICRRIESPASAHRRRPRRHKA